MREGEAPLDVANQRRRVYPREMQSNAFWQRLTAGKSRVHLRFVR